MTAMAGGKPPLDLQPVLAGRHVHLRPLRPDDEDALYAVASDPLIWEQHPDKSRCQEDGFRVFFRKALDCGGALLSLDADTRQVIGSSRFADYDAAASEVQVGWTFLARSHWGGTYNNEMKHLMLRHAFQSVDSVIFVIDWENVRSQRSVERLGGRRDGSRPGWGGRESYVYRVTAQAFALAQPSP